MNRTLVILDRKLATLALVAASLVGAAACSSSGGGSGEGNSSSAAATAAGSMSAASTNHASGQTSGASSALTSGASATAATGASAGNSSTEGDAGTGMDGTLESGTGGDASSGGGDANLPDGSCSNIANGATALAMGQDIAMDPPAAGGGGLAAGTYYLTATNDYASCLQAEMFSMPSTMETWLVTPSSSTAGVIDVALSDAAGDVTGRVAYAISGKMLTLTDVCADVDSGTGLAGSMPFSATSSQILLINDTGAELPGTDGGLCAYTTVSTLTKQ